MTRFSLLNLHSSFKFGKHKGKTVKEIDDKDYILWIVKNTATKFSDEVYDHYGIEKENYEN